MQKNMATGSRGMMATGWLCEQCNFSDIITKFKESRTEAVWHPALTCECQTCGGIHKKGIDSSCITEDEEQLMGNILERLSNPKKQIDGLILINNLDNPSKYLGLVLGTFIWSGFEVVTEIAKNVFTTHATDLQRELIDSVWKKSWKRKGWRPLHGERFKRKVEERSIDIDQILGIGVILNHRISESTFKTIAMLNSPVYVDTALKVNPHLTENYAKRAISEGDSELAVKYLTMAIKGGKHELLRNYVDIKGQEATEFILEQLEEKKPADDSWYQDHDFYDALSRTGAPNAAVVLIEHFCEDSYDRDYLLKIGDANSDDPLIRALNTLNGKGSFDVQEMVTALVSIMDDYEPIEFLVQHYNDLYAIDPEETDSLFSEVIASGDYEKTKRFIRETMGINSSYYQHYLLKKDPDGIRKFLFSDDPGLRLMGTSMGKSEKVDSEIKEFVFMMSFLDPEESVREGAAELVKEKGISQVTGIDSKELIDILFPFGPIVNWRGAPPRSRDFNKREEFLERLIYYEGKQFLPLILEHVQPDSETNTKLDLFLKSFDKNETVEMLLELSIEKAPDTCARNAAMKALSIDKLKTYSRIKDMIQMETGKERTERKQAVDRRLMFIDIFAEKATVEDLPHIQELMKKDRSPRVKRRFAKLMMNIDT